MYAPLALLILWVWSQVAIYEPPLEIMTMVGKVGRVGSSLKGLPYKIVHSHEEDTDQVTYPRHA